MTMTLTEQLADARHQLASEHRPDTRKFWKALIYDIVDKQLQQKGHALERPLPQWPQGTENIG